MIICKTYQMLMLSFYVEKGQRHSKWVCHPVSNIGAILSLPVCNLQSYFLG